MKQKEALLFATYMINNFYVHLCMQQYLRVTFGSKFFHVCGMVGSVCHVCGKVSSITYVMRVQLVHTWYGEGMVGGMDG